VQSKNVRIVRPFVLRVGVLVGAALTVSCSAFLSGDCAGVGLPAVAVTVFDAQTGARAAAEPGYRDWVQSGVRVIDTCSLETRRFDVRLERLS